MFLSIVIARSVSDEAIQSGVSDWIASLPPTRSALRWTHTRRSSPGERRRVARNDEIKSRSRDADAPESCQATKENPPPKKRREALAKANVSAFGSTPDPRFLRPGFNGRYPSSPVSSLPRTAGAGRSAGRSGTQSRPGAVCETARGDRTRSAKRMASGMHPSRARFGLCVT
jgi:hypothetical protein